MRHHFALDLTSVGAIAVHSLARAGSVEHLLPLPGAGEF